MTVEEVNKQIQEIIRKNRMQMNYQISFPVYRILPEEVRLALEVIKKHGMKIEFVLAEK